jgi:DNA-binding GntR family transcriptional regulator
VSGLTHPTSRQEDLEGLLPTSLAGAPTLVEGIRDALRSAIATGGLPAGYRLREVPLAEHFVCSTTPVREAIRKLENEGLVKLYPRRGAEVTSFTTSEVQDLYEIRMVLETFIVRRAAERRPGPEELAPLRRLVEEQEHRHRTGEPGPAIDAEIHQAIAKAGRNPELAELVAQVTRQIEAVQARSQATIEGGLAHASATHRALHDAIAAGDGDAAEREMREHLEWAARAIAESLAGQARP